MTLSERSNDQMLDLFCLNILANEHSHPPLVRAYHVMTKAKQIEWAIENPDSCLGVAQLKNTNHIASQEWFDCIVWRDDTIPSQKIVPLPELRKSIQNIIANCEKNIATQTHKLERQCEDLLLLKSRNVAVGGTTTTISEDTLYVHLIHKYYRGLIDKLSLCPHE